MARMTDYIQMLAKKNSLTQERIVRILQFYTQRIYRESSTFFQVKYWSNRNSKKNSERRSYVTLYGVWHNPKVVRVDRIVAVWLRIFEKKYQFSSEISLLKTRKMEDRTLFDYPFGVRVKFGEKVELIQLDWNNIAPEPFET